MPDAKLPEVINPWDFVAHGQQLQGRLPQAHMPRLIQIVQQPRAAVEFTLRGEVDADGQSILTGQVSTEVQLECQRCLQPFVKPLAKAFTLGLLVSDSQLDQLASQYDPLVVVEEIGLAELIEEELMLALPDIAMHSQEQDCIDLSEHYQAEVAEETTAAPQNPFAALSALLKHE